MPALSRQICHEKQSNHDFLLCYSILRFPYWFISLYVCVLLLLFNLKQVQIQQTYDEKGFNCDHLTILIFSEIVCLELYYQMCNFFSKTIKCDLRDILFLFLVGWITT